jgi:hypothetical protein
VAGRKYCYTVRQYSYVAEFFNRKNGHLYSFWGIGSGEGEGGGEIRNTNIEIRNKFEMGNSSV